MSEIEILKQFYSRIQTDPIIDVWHISLYLSIFNLCSNSKVDWLEVDKETLMALSKISSTATYYRKIGILNKRQYIGYLPSQANGIPTKVKLLSLLES